jgi:hypothetical protein
LKKRIPKYCDERAKEEREKYERELKAYETNET